MFADKINDYLEQAIGEGLEAPAQWEGSSRLPLRIRLQYDFIEARFLSLPVLLAVDLAEDSPSPAKVRKQLDIIQGKYGGDVIVVRETMRAYERKRLIEQKVPFLVPGNQMHLPQMGLSLREVFRKPRKRRDAELSPSAQALLIYLLLGNVKEQAVGVAEIEHSLGYTGTTIRRAFHELSDLDACDVEGFGSGRELRLKLLRPPKEVWTLNLSRLRSPVQRSIDVVSHPELDELLLAGMSALATDSMIAPPQRTVRAIEGEKWTAGTRRFGILEAEPDDPTAVTIQCWRYAPECLATGSVVDPLSLYLSLQGEDDERVQMALEELMESLPW